MKRILVLNYFSDFTPLSSGGELRYFNLYSHLSQYFDITLLSLTHSHHKREAIAHSSTFREHRIPKEQIHDQLQMEVTKDCIEEEFSGLVCALSARHPNAYHEAYLELQADADCIIHASPYMLEYDLLLGIDQRPRIYDCHTFESDLPAHMWRGSAAEKHLSYISDLDSRLIQSSRLCFAVSQMEVKRLAEKHGVSSRCFCIVGNGINPEELMPQPAKERQHAADAGAAHAIKQPSWDSIARRAARKISTCLENWNPPPLRSILLLNDFSVANPRGGGQVRINRLYRSLAAYYQITLVCLIYDGACCRVELGKNFVEIRIPKTASHREMEQAQHWINSPADIVNFLEAPKNPLLKKLVAALHARSDAVILSHPYMAGLIADLEGIPVIFEAHNVESTLKRQILAGHPSYDALIAAAEKCERLAIQFSSEMILVSESDQDSMVLLGGKREHMHVIPNGVDMPSATRKKDLLDHVLAGLEGKPLIVFIGAAHAPNVEAAAYIIDVLARQFPECQFGIVGNVCIYFDSVPPNVLLFGSLDEKSKDTVIELADIAINPMQSGSGSNLKLAEFFAKSLPTVTTAFGARGYEINDGEHAIICSLDDFPKQLRALMHDSKRMQLLGNNAFSFARRHLDWPLQADKLRNVLEQTVFSMEKH